MVSRAKKDVSAWLARLTAWPFTTIIPAHFAAPLKAGPQDVLAAYSFLNPEKEAAVPKPTPKPLFQLPPLFSFGASSPAAGGKKLAPTAKAIEFPERDLVFLKAVDNFVRSANLA